MLTWEELEQTCADCQKCGLWEGRTNPVFGTGVKTAEIMLVGEGPGENEDLQGEPFVGRAGQLLDDMLKIIGLDRGSNVYIANVVKCRPPKNRDPRPEEQEACMGWLAQQLDLVKPRLIICLGRIAASALIHPEFRITREHGQWFDREAVPIVAIYHPSALLRDESKRPETFLDLKAIQRKVQELCPNTRLNYY